MNFGIKKGSLFGNFLGNYNYTAAYVRYNKEGLIHTEKSPSSSYGNFVSLDNNNRNSGETTYQIFLDKPALNSIGNRQILEFSLISGIDLHLGKKNRLNKKNRINLSYRIDLIRSTHTVWEQPTIRYREETSSNLQYFEINYIQLF